MVRILTADLPDWSKYSGDEWPTLVVGNGLSINIWHGFAYDKIFNRARLTAESQTLFGELNTKNFERVLEVLMHAELVLDALSQPIPKVSATYRDVRTQLFDAIRRVHVPWAEVPESSHRMLGRALNKFSAVYTTNYDLLPYWALLRSTNQLVDFFWPNGQVFDPADCDLRGRQVGLYFLHGGIHLWQDDASGQTGKWTSRDGSLLRLGTQFSNYPTRRPLFVSEGTSRAKLRTIRRSDYLTFALDALRSDDRNTVIFGHHLGTQDEHIVDAILHDSRRTVAVGLLPKSRDRLLTQKARFIERLEGQKVVFFNSTTHPLGSSAMNIPAP